MNVPESILKAYGPGEWQYFDNDQHLHGICSWQVAKVILKACNVGAIKSIYYHPILIQDRWTRELKDNGNPVIVYFANSENKEVGYWTGCVHNLTIFDQPRTVNPSWLSKAKYLFDSSIGL